MKKRLLGMALALAMVLALLPATALAGDISPTGDGTPDKPYQISTPAELYWFAATVNGGTDGIDKNTAACAVLKNDITINENVLTTVQGGDTPAKAWTPIGTMGAPYAGVFDGAGHTINGLYCTTTASSLPVPTGLFGVVNGTGSQNKAQVKSVTVKDASITGNAETGGIVGQYRAYSDELKDCAVVGSRVSGSTSGGVCGYNYGTITNCYNTGMVINTSAEGDSLASTGGVCGYNNGTITNCYNIGTVSNQGTGYPQLGGVCGGNDKDMGATITNCYYLDTKESDDFNETTFKTEAEFKTAELAWRLNSTGGATSNSQTWAQGDVAPRFANTEKSDVVYRALFQVANASECAFYLKANDPLSRPPAQANMWPSVPSAMPPEDVSYKAVVSVTSGSTTGYYSTLADAIDAAKKAAGGTTVTLLEDCTASDLVIDSGDVTLDLDGHTLAVPPQSSSEQIMTVSGSGKLTIQDRSVGASGKMDTLGSYAWSVRASDLTDGKLRITGGSFSPYSLSVNNCDLGTVALSGGSMAEIQIVKAEGKISTAADLLADGYAYGDTPQPSETGNDYRIYDITVKQITVNIGTQPTAPTARPYGYAAASDLTLSVTAVKVTEGDGKDVSYQWYKDGTEDANKVGDNQNTYTIPTGLAGGDHVYTCAVTCGSYTVRTEPVTFTVTKTKGVIENNTYPTDYTYTGHAVAAPQAGDFTTNAGTLSYTWLASDGKTALAQAPSDVGSYKLRVNAAATDGVSDAVLEVPVTIAYLQTDAAATLATTNKGDNGWYTGPVTVNAPEGYTISTSTSTESFSASISTTTNGTNTYYLKNAAGYIAQKSIAVQYDDVKPTVPTLRISTVATDTTAVLTAAATDATSGIQAYTLTEANGKIGVQTSTDGVFSLTGLTADTDYSFTATARDKAGNVSDASTACAVKTEKTSLVTATVELTGADSFEYDNTAKNPGATVTLGDKTLEADQYTISYANTNGGEGDHTSAGTVTVTVAASADGSYSGTATAKPTFQIAPRPLTPGIAVGFGGTAAKVYDGTVKVLPSQNLILSLPDVMSGDGVTATAAGIAYDNKNAGTGKTILAAGIALQGAKSGNYTLNGVTTASIKTGAISAKPVAVTISGESSAVYGETFAHKANYTPLNGDTASAGILYDDSATKPTNVKMNGNDVAAYALTAFIRDRNYQPSSTTGTTSFAITQATLSGTQNPARTLRYNNTAQQTLTAADFGISMAGSFVANGSLTDAKNVLDGEPTFDEDVTYQIKTDLSFDNQQVSIPVTFTPTDTNYAAVNLTATITLSERNTVVLGLMADKTAAVNYGDSVTYVATLQKDAALTDALDGSITFYLDGMEESNLLNTKPISDTNSTVNITLDRSKLTAGGHTVHAVYSGNSYYVTASASIATSVTASPLTWDVSGLSARKPADGNTDAAVTGALLVSGALEDDDPGFGYTSLSGVYAGAEAGSHTVTVTVTDGALTNPNYALPTVSPTFTGAIHAVESLPTPPESDSAKPLKLEKEAGISEVPPAVTGKHPELDTPAKIEAQMRHSITAANGSIPTANIEVFDINLFISTDGGASWAEAAEADIPTEGITVLVPYPAGTSQSSHDFVITHMLTTGDKAGTTETITPTKTAEGLKFKLMSLSPIAVGYKPVAASGGGHVATYTLTFDVDGGSAIANVKLASGTTIDLSAYKPTKEGFTFAGWYMDAKLTEEVTSVKLTQNMTIYAKWTENTPAGLPFTDVPVGAWYYDDVAFVYENKLMNGTGNETFSPATNTTRGMIVTILYRLEGEPAVVGTSPFDDVKSGSYYEKAVVWAAQNDIVNGYDAHRFGPNDPISREQMAVILYRYAVLKQYSTAEAADLSKFSDSDQTRSYAREALAWANAEELLNGVGSGLLDPAGTATRAQVAAILHRFIKKY